jgi:hypothetical protein
VQALNRHAGSYTEPAISVNPMDPTHLAAAFQVPASVAYSTDSGEHWDLATGAAPADYHVSGDVSITYDILGHAILCYIAFDKLGTSEYWAHNATRNGIYVRRSLDGGKTWEAHASAIDEQPTRAVMPFEDKPYIFADNNSNSPFGGNLYVGWTEFSLDKSIILFSRSTDGGITWSPPFEISTHEGLPRDDNGAVEGFSGVAGPDGSVYVIWSDGPSIVMARSNDGGLTFGDSRKIFDTAASYFKVQDVERSDGFPQIGIDPRTERLFVTWTDFRNGDVDVFCATSSDRGRNWSGATRVNNDPIHNGADQFFQWLAVDPADASANVVFYDRRDDPDNLKSLVVLARSTDGGKTFANYAWTTKPFDAHNGFIGDYTGITALNGRVYGVWTETRPIAILQAPKKPEAAPKPKGHTAPPDAAETRSLPTVIEFGLADFRPGAK